ncbi:MAG: hypothetical protein DIU61_014445 [Bacteroidota bacterium]|jgi:ribosomal protein S8E
MNREIRKYGKTEIQERSPLDRLLHREPYRHKIGRQINLKPEAEA